SAVTYTLADGVNGGLASNYSLAAGSATGVITAKGVTIGGGSVLGKVYDGNTTASVTASVTITGLVAGEALGTTTATGTFASKDVGTRSVAASYTLTDGANPLHLAGNYNLLNPTETLSAAITAKGLSITAPLIGSKVYDGNTTAGVVTVGTLSGFVGSETVTASGAAANYSSANVGSYSSAVTYTLADGVNGGLASNYSLAAGSATGVITAKITAKSLTVSGGAVTTKVYDGTTAAAITGAGLQLAISVGTGTSTDGKPYSVDSVALAGGTSGTFERYLPGTLIPVSTTMSVTGSGSGNYTVTQPTTLKGEITGSANLNRNGVALAVNSGSFLHIRDTTA
ncbi:MAG: hypothetical protein EBT77_08450, partial [Verrucomicrobia bacterium]|nr:hypothetical protein [Verrucomicrobiota bacterium]